MIPLRYGVKAKVVLFYESGFRLQFTHDVLQVSPKMEAADFEESGQSTYSDAGTRDA